MTDETVGLARYAAELKYEDIPAPIRQRARDSITDTVATMVFGRDFPWSRMITDYARRMGGGGNSRILGDGDAPVKEPYAALANGAYAHAFELDGALRPSCGAHPGATILSATLAMAQGRGLGGKELLTAFITGSEVMIRIGRATLHSNETRGFHAPGNGDVVVFNQYRVIQTKSMVAAATDTNRVFLHGTQARHGFAGAGDFSAIRCNRTGDGSGGRCHAT